MKVIEFINNNLSNTFKTIETDREYSIGEIIINNRVTYRVSDIILQNHLACINARLEY